MTIVRQPNTETDRYLKSALKYNSNWVATNSSCNKTAVGLIPQIKYNSNADVVKSKKTLSKEYVKGIYKEENYRLQKNTIRCLTIQQ